MNYVYIILFIIVLLFIYMHFEAKWVQIKRVDFTKSSKGLKILHLSDIHINMLRVPVEKTRRIIKKEKPDIIIISGDFIEKPVDASRFLDYLQTIKQSYKVYLCMGNHDYQAYTHNPAGVETFIREIEAIKATVLRNSSVLIEKNASRYNLIGIDDLREGYPNIDEAMKGCLPADANIVLTHNPDLALELYGRKIDYLFCGHFHGGQIWMPFNLEFFLLRKDKLCRHGMKRGLHKLNGINIYISRGLGNVVVPLRFISRPEITVYTIP